MQLFLSCFFSGKKKCFSKTNFFFNSHNTIIFYSFSVKKNNLATILFLLLIMIETNQHKKNSPKIPVICCILFHVSPSLPLSLFGFKFKLVSMTSRLWIYFHELRLNEKNSISINFTSLRVLFSFFLIFKKRF